MTAEVHGVRVQLLARLNKERLGVLLKEMQDKSSGDTRYAAALR